jgi:hypothetical protein
MITNFLLYFTLLFPGNTHRESIKNASHPFFVSVTQIEENTTDKILEVSCKIFTDDFEKTLRMHYDRHVDLLHPKDKTAMNALVQDYIKKHLKITVDGKPGPLQFVGYEQNEEGVECYFQVNNVSVKKAVSVFNDLLFEYKPEQTNIVHVTVRHKRKSRQLVNPENTVNFSFD